MNPSRLLVISGVSCSFGAVTPRMSSEANKLTLRIGIQSGIHASNVTFHRNSVFDMGMYLRNMAGLGTWFPSAISREVIGGSLVGLRYGLDYTPWGICRAK